MKRWIATVSAAAMSAALLVPIGAATAQESPGQEGPAPVDPAVDPVGKTVAESETGSYIVVMAADPLVATIAPDDLDTPAGRRAGGGAGGDPRRGARRSRCRQRRQGAGLHERAQRILRRHQPRRSDQARRVSSMSRSVVPDELRQLTTDSSGEFLGLTGPGDAYASGLTGENVVVGVIDTGIWPEHPSFADDGSYGPSPVGALDESERSSCDFGNLAHNPNDAPFSATTSCWAPARCSPRTARSSAPRRTSSTPLVTIDGHGTHTASTAAGNAGVDAAIFGRDYGEISGIAPRARVIAYKGLGNLGGFTSDLAAAIDQAVADGVDVINYSIGGGANPSLLSGDGIAFLFAADAGVWVATSAGNSGPGAATIGVPASVPWITSVGASTQERFFEGTVELGSTRARSNSGKGNGGASARQDVLRCVGDARHDRALPLVDAASAGSDLCLRGDARSRGGRGQDRPVPSRRDRPGREGSRRVRGRWRGDDPVQQHRLRQPVHRHPLAPRRARRQHRRCADQGVHRLAGVRRRRGSGRATSTSSRLRRR